MTFDNDLSQDVSLQQGEFLELWESSRFTQRQDPLSSDHAENYQGSQFAKDGSGKDIDLPRNHQLGSTVPKTENDGKGRARDSEDEDSHLLDNEDPSRGRAGGPPTWLSSALLRQQNHLLDETEHGHVEAEKWCPVCSSGGSQTCICSTEMPSGCTNATSFLHQGTYTHWLVTGIHASQHRPGEFGDGKDDKFGGDQQQTSMATDLNLAAAHGRDSQRFMELTPLADGLRYAGDYHRGDWDSARRNAEWEDVRRRCMIVNHPLYEEMLANHADCLRVGTPTDLLPTIETQLSQAPAVIEKYKLLHDQLVGVTEAEQLDLDRCMTDYTMILSAFKDLLQHHVFTDVTAAMMSCWELEQALYSLTGATPQEGSGATMSDEDEEYDSDYGAYDHRMDYHDSGGYGPLVPTETERTLMERVRQELKHELKQGYKSKIEDVREEILRKRRAGKLPEGTTTVLKAWWHAHSKWPYPTIDSTVSLDIHIASKFAKHTVPWHNARYQEDEKELLIQETGLELKQVNNWFINQRKRNWHSNPLMQSHADSKIKVRKSW